MKKKVYREVVKVFGFPNAETEFSEYIVCMGERPSKKDQSPENHHEKHFVIKPASGHYLVLTTPERLCSVPAVCPAVIDIYHKPAYAVRRLEKEVTKYVNQLIKETGCRLLTSSGLKDRL